jgi:hypothetical protein
MMFLLVSCQRPLLALVFLEAKLKDFLSSALLTSTYYPNFHLVGDDVLDMFDV